MRTSLILAAVITTCQIACRQALAASPDCAAPSCAAPICAAFSGSDGGSCDACGNGCSRGRGRRGPRYEGLDPAFNCGCNGSYKFPVPPLYTYHWPGLYSAQLMTDYHSPWRFPPLKSYVDEVPAVEMGASQAVRSVRPVSLSLPIEARPAGEMEAMSSKLLR